jgi:hypothetical protein
MRDETKPPKHRPRKRPEPKLLEINFNISIDLDRARAWREIVRAIAAAAVQFMPKEDAVRMLERVESFIGEPAAGSPNPASPAPPQRERREMRPGDWIPDRRPTDPQR